MTSSTGLLLSPREILEMLFRHKRKLIAFPIVVLLCAAVVLVFAPRTYRSEAQLYLQVGRASVGLDPTATTGQTINYSQSGRDEEIKSAMDIILSSGLIGKAVDRMGVDVAMGHAGPGAGSPSFFGKYVLGSVGALIGMVKRLDPISEREQAILDIKESLTVDAERESTVLVLKYDASSPELAQLTLNALVEIYQEEHARIHRKQESLEFFDEQRQILQDQLEQAVTALRDAKNKMGIASVVGHRETLENQMESVQLEHLQTEQNIATALARMQEIEKQLTRLPDRLVASRKSVPNSGADLMRDQLYELQVKQKDMLARYTPNHPQVIAISKQIEAAKKIVVDEKPTRDETSDEVNPIHQQLMLELKQQEGAVAGLQSRKIAAEEQIANLQEEIKKLNEFEIRMDELEREAQLRREKFMKYAQNVEEARIDEQLAQQRISDVSIVQSPTLSEKPVSPSKLLIALATLLMSTGGTGALVFFSEKLDTRIRASRELQEALGVPVLGVIPESPVYGRVQVKR